jgi:hypothetical protein
MRTLAIETQEMANKLLDKSKKAIEGGVDDFYEEFDTEDFMKLTHDLSNSSTTMLCGMATTLADIQDRLDKIEEKL